MKFLSHSTEEVLYLRKALTALYTSLNQMAFILYGIYEKPSTISPTPKIEFQ